MENYAGLIVYLWSIWGGIVGNIIFITISLGVAVVFSLIFLGIFKVEKYEAGAKFMESFQSKAWKPLIGLWILAILIPSKENMLLIIAANPVAKTITQSYTDGKISKINELTDVALDKALEKLKGIDESNQNH